MLRANSSTLTSVIPLPQGKAMIPLRGELLEDADIPFLPLTDEGGPETICSIDEFVSSLIGRGRFVYVEAELFGGDGTQACVTWDENGKSLTPMVATDATNIALRFLGVQVAGHRDEFAALGLGKYRETQAWLAETVSKPN